MQLNFGKRNLKVDESLSDFKDQHWQSGFKDWPKLIGLAVEWCPKSKVYLKLVQSGF